MTNYTEIVNANLEALSTSTIVSGELATAAYQKGLVTKVEFEQLNAAEGLGCTNYTKATFLYTGILPKWTDADFDVFLSVLERSGNGRALEIISSRSCGARSINDLVEEILAKRSTGQFEGYLLEDELEAKVIVEFFDTKPNEGLLGIARRLFKSDKAPSKVAQEKKERLCEMMTCGQVWWNGEKPQLPPYYIERRVCNETSRTTLLDLVVPSDNDDPHWTKWTNDQVLILPVDSPGMGKSCALMRLEQELREKLNKSPRVIVRINLNSVGIGVGESSVESGVQEAIRELFEPLKDISSGEKESPVYILLDGLDEVLPQNQESVLSVIEFLLSDSAVKKGWVVEKIVLNTRPHLKEKIEKEFKVASYSLVPLTKDEQVEFIQKRTRRRDALELLDDLSRETRELISNPLMLSMFCSVVVDTTKFNQYGMYMQFMEKKHELYASEKEGRSNVPNRVLKQMLTRSLPFYNYVAIREVVGEDNLKLILGLSEKAGELVQKVASPEKQTELISYGIVAKDGQELRFAHRSFAEFFYARLMTDVGNRLMTDVDSTPGDVRNAMFALGYKKWNNLAKFVSCVIGKNADAVQFVSSGCTQFVPEMGTLGGYVKEKGILCDHILSIAIGYEVNCPRNDELVIRDIYEERIGFVRWLSEKQDEPLVQDFLRNENNTRILGALAFNVDYADNNTKNVYRLQELCFDLSLERSASMSQQQIEVIAQDILRDTRYNMQSTLMSDFDCDPRIYTFLASVLSREKLYHLIVNEETRVSDLIARTGLRSLSACLVEKFLPKRLLKFRFKFGMEKEKILFNYKFPEELMERVWEEIEEKVQDAVQVAQDNEKFIRLLENYLRRLKVSSEVREKRRRLLRDVLATVDWTSFKWEPKYFGYYSYLNMIAYGNLEGREWERSLLRKEKIEIRNSTEKLNYLLACLMLSAINEDRAHVQHQSTSSVTVRAPLELVRIVARKVHVYDSNRILYSFIAELSREELLDLARMRTKDPVLLSDLPSAWELFFHAEKGIANAQTKTEKALKVLNEKHVLEIIVKDLLESNDRSLSPEDELIRVFFWERGLVREERVKEAMTEDVLGYININMLDIIAQSARYLWLKDVKLGRNYMMGMVQLYLDIFKGEVDYWVKPWAERIPVQLLVVTEDKVKRSVGDSEYVNLLKLVQKCIRDLLRNKLTLKTIRFQRQLVKYNRQCDWFELLNVVLNESPEMKNKIPVDYANRTKVYRPGRAVFFACGFNCLGRKRQGDRRMKLVKMEPVSGKEHQEK